MSKKSKNKKKKSVKNRQKNVYATDEVFLCCSAQLNLAQKDLFLSDAEFSTIFHLNSVNIECVGCGNNFLIRIYANKSDAEMIFELLKFGWMSPRWRRKFTLRTKSNKK